ncbi:hypothetical protein IQ07DRAFT_678579 [Pyrenochaeta sp. DS3sAY3a]|nr:hypothetical protein IQ07DRAFT_678579 [Pyrenochaeta sp. DS3sAY3a]
MSCSDADIRQGTCPMPTLPSLLGPPPAPTHQVSWQSVFWPVITLSLALMLQNTGRVCGGHYRDSYALRSSPFICVVDTVLILAKFTCLLGLGCPLRVAARHVWYARFEAEEVEAGCTLDLWRGMLMEVVVEVKSSLESGEGSFVRGGRDCEIGENEGDCTENQDGSQTKGVTDIPLKPLAGYTGTSSVPHRTKQVLDLKHEPRTAPPGHVLPSIASAHLRPLDPLNFDLESTYQDPFLLPSPAPIYPGSAITRLWRLNMAGFLLGAFPQAIKVFGMKGVPITQTVIAFQLGSFLATEVFRFVAGPAGAERLHPLMAVVEAKRAFVVVRGVALVLGVVASVVFYVFCFAEMALYSGDIGEQKNTLVLVPLVVIVFAGVLLGAVACLRVAVTKNCPWLCVRSARFDNGYEAWLNVRSKIVTCLAKLFALDTAFLDSWITLVLLYPLLLLLVASAFLVVGPRLDWNSNIGLEILAIWTLLLCQAPIVLFIFYLLFRLLFMGAISVRIRKMLGLHGTMAEFCAAAFVAMNLFSAFVSYAGTSWDSGGTYKPDWADSLG